MGEDIDTIEIVLGRTGGSKARRGRMACVRMRKQGAALDAEAVFRRAEGLTQTIVIRLALAQTFCLKCGILAFVVAADDECWGEAKRRSLARRAVADHC